MASNQQGGNQRARCPCCNRPGQPAGLDLFRCASCGALFDSDPDEGGDYGNRPEARLEREERRRERANQKLAGRLHNK